MIKEYLPCKDCSTSSHPGYCKDEFNNVTECDCLLKYNKYISFMKYLQTVGVPQSYLDYDISEYIGKHLSPKINILEKSLKEFCNKGLQLYFSGEPNTQKTSIAIYLLKKAILQKNSAYYTTMINLINLLKKEYKSRYDTFISSLDLIDRIAGCDLLIIDDSFDPKKIYVSSHTEEEQILFFNFLKNRIAWGKSQIYISNVPKAEIDFSTFNKCLYELVYKDCVEILFEDGIPTAKLNNKVLSFFSGSINEVKKEIKKD